MAVFPFFLNGMLTDLSVSYQQSNCSFFPFKGLNCNEIQLISQGPDRYIVNAL